MKIMNEQSQLVITNVKGNDVTTSYIIAQVFGKNHADVLRDIRNLHCSDEFRQDNFAEIFDIKVLPNNGHRHDRFYEITKDGFSFLVMGYTGKKAAIFKERLIREFKNRESLLKSDDYIIDRGLEIAMKRQKTAEADILKQNDYGNKLESQDEE
jgi:Rha family phage regulatory protein